jgi:hypothetical protein
VALVTEMQKVFQAPLILAAVVEVEIKELGLDKVAEAQVDYVQQ